MQQTDFAFVIPPTDMPPNRAARVVLKVSKDLQKRQVLINHILNNLQGERGAFTFFIFSYLQTEKYVVE